MTQAPSEHRPWVRLDNASNIFLAARTEVDPKVFRMSVELDHDVDPDLLQRALDATFERFPLYRAVLRRGIFWYYLEDSDLRPRVEPDDAPTCAPLYRSDRRNLLFRVLYHRRRIALEIFHALSDGTGALWFVSDLVTEYLRLRHPEQRPEASAEDTLGDDGWPRDRAEQMHGLVPDSFGEHFRGGRRRGARALTFDEAAAGPTADAQPEPAPRAPVGAPGVLDRPAGRVYRARGTRTPDNRPRLVELTMPAKQVLARAKAERVTLTMYLTALFFESIRAAAGDLGRRRTIAASIPVNLRQFFESTSARNFFATVRVEHTYGEGDDSVGAVARHLDAQFRPRASREALETKLRTLIRLERSAILRVVPRPLKDVILRLVNLANNRGLTVAISNLGRVGLPAPGDAHIRRMFFHVTAVRPQFCAMSHGDTLTVSFTSPFVETDHVREFARHLTAAGVDVSLAAAPVTEAEVEELAR